VKAATVAIARGDIACPARALQGGLSARGTCFAQGQPGTYHCKVCNSLLQEFDGSQEVAYRLTVHPSILPNAPIKNGHTSLIAFASKLLIALPARGRSASRDFCKTASVGGLFHFRECRLLGPQRTSSFCSTSALRQKLELAA